MNNINFYLGKVDKPVSDYREWEREYRKVDDYHWEVGRSAESLANYWMNHNQDDLFEMLKSIGFNDSTLNNGYIEKELRFDSAGGTHAMSDLCFPQAILNGDKVTISIEAKVSEPFGSETCLQYYKNAKKTVSKNPRSNTLNRIESMFKVYKNDVDSDKIEDTAFGELRYQLFSGLSGTIAEAKRQDSKVAIYIIHTFETSKLDPDSYFENKRAFENFSKYLGLGYDVQSGDICEYENKSSLINEGKFKAYYDTNGLKIYVGYLKTKLD